MRQQYCEKLTNYQIEAVWNRIIYVAGNSEYDSKQNNQLGCKG